MISTYWMRMLRVKLLQIRQGVRVDPDSRTYNRVSNLGGTKCQMFTGLLLHRIR